MIDLKLLEDELKCAITQCLYEFTDKYAAPGSDFYPYVLPTMKKVLTESISEVKRQAGERHLQESDSRSMALLLGVIHGSLNVILFTEESKNKLTLYTKIKELHNMLGKSINEMFYEAHEHA